MTFFSRFTAGADKAPTAADTCELVEARRAYVEATFADLERARETYHKYLNAAAMVGLDVNTPEVEKHERDLAAATQRHERALAALTAAESEHAQATGRELTAARKAEWDAREAVAARHTAAAAALSAKASELAEASNAFARVHRELYGVLPVSVRSQATNAIFARPPFAMTHDELERVEAWPDPRNGSGIPKPKPLAAISADMHVMLKQMRADAGA